MKTNQDLFTIRDSVAMVCGALLALALAPVARSADTETESEKNKTVQESTLPAAPATDAGVNKPAPAGKTDAAVPEENAELIEQTTPANLVEIGAGNVSKDSFKFGEYNGLQREGVYGVGNVDLRGGGSYDSDNAQRWRITGTDLGLDTRDVTAEYGQQGRFRFNFGYDELRRNRSDSYQTPYFGAGSSNLTLPSNWLVPVVPTVSASAPNARGLSQDVANSPGAPVSGGRFTTTLPAAPTAGQLATSNAIIGADLPDFHHFDLSTKRTRTDLGFSFNVDPEMDLKFSYRHENKDGNKPMGTVTRATGGDISTIIPDPINQSTDQFNVSMNYTDKKEFFQAAYYGSLFHNDISSVTWQNWADPTKFATMSSAPSNQFHQFSLTGGYNFTPTTKLVMNGSYARNTQDDAFLTDASTPVVPATSLKGLVVTKAFNIKLTTKAASNLNLSAGYKYDDRDNRTPVNIYQYADASEAPVANASFPAGPNNPYGAVLAQNANANRPYSKKLDQFDLGADWRMTQDQWLKGGYQYQKIDRSCNDATWIDCVDAATTKENTLSAEYRNSVLENISGRVGYARSKRTVEDYNEDAFLALVPYANVIPAGQTMSAYQALQLYGLTGYGPALGYNGGVFVNNTFFPSNNALPNALYANNNRISELIGMRRYNMADRNRDKLRSSIDWQATDQLFLQAGIDYNQDDYSQSVYGLQNAKSWALNLDGTYAASQELSFTVFYTYEDQRSESAGNTYSTNSNTANVGGFTTVSGGCYSTVIDRNNNAKTDPCNNWSADMRDKVDTLGFEFKKKNFFSQKLDVVGDLVFTRARSENNVSGGNYVTNPYAVAGQPAGTVAMYFIPATSLPTVSTDTIELRLNGRYKLDKASTVQVGYTYAHMKSRDWAYDGMQNGGLSGVLPTLEQAPNYSVNVIVVGYQYLWR